MNKAIKILLIIFLVLLIAFLVCGIVFFANKNLREIKLNNKFEADVSEVNKIYLDLGSIDVELKESDKDKILVEYYSNTDKDIEITNKENCITIEKDANYDVNKFVFFNYKKVVIYVPKTFIGEYELKVQSGDIKSEIDLSNNLANITTSSGDISLNIIGEANVTSSSGDIKINKISKKANITASSGDININTLDIKDSSSITASSGDIEIKNNQSNCYVEAETRSGDTKVNKSDRKSDIVLKIKTSSGDINVN